MKILRAKKSDLKEAGKLMNKEFSKQPFNEKDSMKDIIKSLEFYFKLGKIFVTIIEEKIVGVIVVKFEQYWEGKVMIIEDLAVDSKFQKLGVGKELMSFIEKYSRKKKAKFILFKTHRKSQAIKFYKRLGYKEDKDSVFMKKLLK